MDAIIAVILEIIKVTTPALIVFLTVFYLVKNYLASQRELKMLDFKQNQHKTTIPLRLQAYERLSLFCERISIPGLILRVRDDKMTATHLKYAMLISIQKEFEHNITQQVYVSDQLWQIIKISRDDVVGVINQVYSEIDPEADYRTFSTALFKFLEQRDYTPLDTALAAIKKEAGLLL